MRKFSCSVLVAGALALTACSAEEASDNTDVNTAAESQTVAEEESTGEAQDSSSNSSLVREKKVGEKAGWGCTAVGSDDCDFHFVLDRIEKLDSCPEEYGQPIPEGRELIVVEATQEMRTELKQFTEEEASFVPVMLQWSVLDGEGNDSPAIHSAECFNNEIGNWDDSIFPGDISKSRNYFDVPAGATEVRLTGTAGSGRWIYQIP